MSPLRSSFCCAAFRLLHPDDRVHGRSGEQASKIPSVEILHRETGNKVFGEASRCDCSVPLLHLCRLFVCFIVFAMADINNGVVVETFSVNTYVLLKSLFALVVGPYADL